MSIRARRGLRWFAATLAVFALLVFDLSPRTPVAGQPSAQESASAIAVLRRLREDNGSAEPTQVALTTVELKQTVGLAGRAGGFPRTGAEVEANAVAVRTSIDMPLGLWLNLSANIERSRKGFPRITGRVGRLPVPAFVMRVAIDAYLGRVRKGGVALPDPDVLVRTLDVDAGGIRALVQIPPESTLFGVANQSFANRVEPGLVIAHYCPLAALQREQPVSDLGALMRRSFGIDQGRTDAAANRARLVAVSMILVSKEAGGLAGVSEEAVAQCPAPANSITLLGRTDLAQHFSLSAAVAVTVNQAFSRRLGLWKELADSSSGGTGFSFVDLSADRAGLMLARRLSSPEIAVSTAKKMRTIDEQQLLPIGALALSEGLSEHQFRARYVDQESKAYRDMVARIDAVLGKNY